MTQDTRIKDAEYVASAQAVEEYGRALRAAAQRYGAIMEFVVGPSGPVQDQLIRSKLAHLNTAISGLCASIEQVCADLRVHCASFVKEVDTADSFVS